MTALRMNIMLLLFLYPFSWVFAEVRELAVFNSMFYLQPKSKTALYVYFTRDKIACPLGKKHRDYRCITKQNISTIFIGEQVKGSRHIDIETSYTLVEVMHDGAAFTYDSLPRNDVNKKESDRSTGKIFVRFK